MKKKIMIMGVILSVLMVAGVLACYAATTTVTDGNYWQEEYADSYTQGRTMMLSYGTMSGARTETKNTTAGSSMYVQSYVAEYDYASDTVLNYKKSAGYLTSTSASCNSGTIDRDYDEMYRYYLHKSTNQTDNIMIQYNVYQFRH